MKKIFFLIVFICFISADIKAQTVNDITPDILSMRDRAEVMDRWTEHRLDHLVPELMRRRGGYVGIGCTGVQ